eukprot:SAG11_NODE_24252_length_376_cov_0.664260_1_plen_70_part_01
MGWESFAYRHVERPLPPRSPNNHRAGARAVRHRQKAGNTGLNGWRNAGRAVTSGQTSSESIGGKPEAAAH